MNRAPESTMNQALDWCSHVLGHIDILSDHSKTHGGHESSTCRLRVASGVCYLKVHSSPTHWNNEVHAYEHWVPAFGNLAPRLLAVRDTEPLALVISELAGLNMEDRQLSASQEQSAWRAAGVALPTLHNLEAGEYFGPCLRNGTYADEIERDATTYVTRKFEIELDRAIRLGYLDARETAILQRAFDLIPVFEGERPTPCHRDYCTANWLVSEDGALVGVIDFEFAHWDVRVADFARDPNWSWIHRPDLVGAFFQGYGRPLSSTEEQQLLVARAQYALGAIIWGREYSFFGFEREGHQALAYLASWLA